MSETHDPAECFVEGCHAPAFHHRSVNNTVVKACDSHLAVDAPTSIAEDVEEDAPGEYDPADYNVGQVVDFLSELKAIEADETASDDVRAAATAQIARVIELETAGKARSGILG